MKTKAICSFFVLFAIVAGIGATTPAAFADESQGNPHNIETADTMLAIPGCLDEEVGCYTPNTMTVDVGHTVTMINADATNIHTFTSGTVENNVGTPDDIFDSQFLMKQGDSYDYLADTVGEFPYYCSLHVWMQGVLIVQEAAAEEEMQMEETMMEEVELMVTITESAMGDGTHVYLEFSEIHVNYEMIGMQNDEEIFTIPGHAMEMTSDHHIDAVGSDESPIDIEIVSLGIGPPDAEDDWTEPTGTVATTQIVPEFGTIAMMVLAVAIISIVAVT
ncbi:MAG: PEFG-CTERM sorting domain-containing protein, partial [Nitrosopumilus sp.]